MSAQGGRDRSGVAFPWQDEREHHAASYGYRIGGECHRTPAGDRDEGPSRRRGRHREARGGPDIALPHPLVRRRRWLWPTGIPASPRPGNICGLGGGARRRGWCRNRREGRRPRLGGRRVQRVRRRDRPDGRLRRCVVAGVDCGRSGRLRVWLRRSRWGECARRSGRRRRGRRERGPRRQHTGCRRRGRWRRRRRDRSAARVRLGRRCRCRRRVWEPRQRCPDAGRESRVPDGGRRGRRPAGLVLPGRRRSRVERWRGRVGGDGPDRWRRGRRRAVRRRWW